MRNNNVCVFHGGFDELIIAWLNKFIVLLKDILDSSASLRDISLDSPRQTDVVVGHHKDLQVHQVPEPLLIEGENSLKYNQGLAFHSLSYSNLSEMK